MLELICKELEVEIGEEWTGNDGYNYRIANNGEIFLYDERGFYTGKRGFNVWERILTGELKPKWKPKIREAIYVADPTTTRGYAQLEWRDGSWYKDVWGKGLVFKSPDEAIKATKKMIKAIKEDENDL